MGARMLAVLGAVVALGAAALEAHRRDMRRVELTDAASDAYRAGVRVGVRSEVARVAAEAEAERDGAGERLTVTGVTQDAQGLHVTGVLPSGAVADALAQSLGDYSVGFRADSWPSSAELDESIARLMFELGQRYVPPSERSDQEDRP